MKETTKKYLLENNINSEEQLANHILELRRNTFVKPILFELVDLLYNKKSVLLSFFAQKNSKKGMLIFTELEKNIITEKEQENLSREHIKKSKPMFLDEVLDRIENQQPTVTFSTNSTFPIQMKRGKIIEYYKLYDEDEKLKRLQSKGYDEIRLTDVEKIGVKYNKNKPKMSVLFKQFPDALEAVVRCSEYGHNKYKDTDKDWLNFKRIEGGSEAYEDAGIRHRLQKGNDLESGLPHKYHTAWNALAELQLWIEENEK